MDLWMPHIPVWEIVLRSLVVFFALLILIRISGKRDVGEMSPSDLILLLLLSANVHTSLSGSDKSLLGGIIGAAALMLTNQILNRIAFKNSKFERVLKGHPELLIYKGKICQGTLKKHQLTKSQLKIAVRKEGFSQINDVRLAVLETDGTISVVKE